MLTLCFGRMSIAIDEKLARAIHTLATNDELRVEFGAAGQQRVRDMLTWDENARRYVEAYSNAANPARLSLSVK